MDEKKPPANYWATLISLGGLVMSAAALMSATGKTDREDARRLEQRLCRLEAIGGTGECKR